MRCQTNKLLNVKFFKIKNNKDGKRELAIPDIPTFAFMGFSLGFLLVGVFTATVGGLFNLGESASNVMTTIMTGIITIGISILCSGIGYLYWYLIPSKYGIIKPELSGFGLIAVILALISSALIATDFTIWLNNRFGV